MRDQVVYRFRDSLSLQLTIMRIGIGVKKFYAQPSCAIRPSKLKCQL